MIPNHHFRTLLLILSVCCYFFYSSIFLFSMCTVFCGGYRELNIQLNFKKTSVPRLNLFFWSCFFFNILLSTLFCTEAFYRCIVIFGYIFTFKSEAAHASLGTSQVVPAQTFQFCASGQETLAVKAAVDARMLINV